MSKAQAAEFKAKGNAALAASNFDEAIENYTKVCIGRRGLLCCARSCLRQPQSWAGGRVMAISFCSQT